jgi:zinc D-Ala-D-Ala carboxypeptidase
MIWDFFSEEELKCKGTGECDMDERFMSRLVKLRKDFNQPMIISSGYRHESYNQVIGGAKNSPHLYGKAVDVLVSGKVAYRLMNLAMKHGFTGIGISQRGNHDKRFLHIDTMEDSNVHPRPWVWSYK